MALKQDSKNEQLQPRNAGYLVLSPAQVSRVLAVVMVGMLFVFASGYYSGKKGQSEEMTAHVKHDAFADHIYSSLCTVYPVGKDETER